MAPLWSLLLANAGRKARGLVTPVCLLASASVPQRFPIRFLCGLILGFPSHGDFGDLGDRASLPLPVHPSSSQIGVGLRDFIPTDPSAVLPFRSRMTLSWMLWPSSVW